ncbi:MAG: flagellar biosynthesis anti-sigma factor FlgM [Synergistetes bacterium]|nr:flagellar biosynthesis anti-sigma factor FlgM [Synergistota bacterium]MCX8127170.1 flagellar biosynthesis anti-sigma factor FlgM [Synergistota bacterium]MDW8191944.1 flagellar biosynthesis anti-sigma factor FlgM [Synergistota bacterium]
MEYGKKIGEIFKTYLEGIKPIRKKIKFEEESKVSSADDKVEISSRAVELKIAKDALSKVPDIRKEKVEEIKKLIEEGKYNPDLKQVARKILEEFYFSSGE